MPCISQFYGISIYLYHYDHAPPHIHAVLAEHNASFAILSGERFAGDFPPRAERLVREWLEVRRPEVMASWDLSHGGDPPCRVAPLDRGGPMNSIPRVVFVRVCGPTSLELGFADGVRKRVNIGPLLRGRVFEPLLDPAYFAKAAVDPVGSTVVWPNGADIAPETLYEMPEEPCAPSQPRA